MRLATSVFLLTLVGVPLSAIAAEGSPTSASARPPKVTVVPATQREVIARTTVSGTLVPREDVMVLPEIDGLVIEQIMAEEGDHVREGQVLAKLSRTMLDVQMVQNAANLARNDSAIAQSEAQIAEAQANQAQAASALERSTTLKTSGITSLDQFEQRQAAARSTAAKLQSAIDGLAAAKADKTLTEAQRQELLVRLQRTEIKAPRGGLISRRNARLGAVASLSGDPLFKVIADGQIELEADVPEAELARIQMGQSAKVTPPGFDDPITGTVRLVSPEIDKTTRLGRVRISLPKDSVVMVGSFARGSIETGRRTGVTVPVQAITYTRAGPIVQVVIDDKVQSRSVTLGLIGNGIAEVLAGVSAGEAVVARAGTFVRDGDNVSPVQTEQKEALR